MPVYSAGDLVVDISRHRVTERGVEVHLTVLELAVLSYLISEPGRVRSAEDILARVWGEEYLDEYDVDRQLVRAVVSRLRKKIQPGMDGPQYVRTHRGVGYFVQGTD